MADIESAIQARLADQVTLVPDARIRTRGDWQNLSQPYIVHFPVTGGPKELAHGEVLSVRQHPYYQVSVFAESYSSCKAAEVQILDALHGWSTAAGVQLCKHVSTITAYDLETKTHHLAMNFTIWEALAA